MFGGPNSTSVNGKLHVHHFTSQKKFHHSFSALHRSIQFAFVNVYA